MHLQHGFKRKHFNPKPYFLGLMAYGPLGPLGAPLALWQGQPTHIGEADAAGQLTYTTAMPLQHQMGVTTSPCMWPQGL